LVLAAACSSSSGTASGGSNQSSAAAPTTTSTTVTTTPTTAAVPTQPQSTPAAAAAAFVQAWLDGDQAAASAVALAPAVQSAFAAGVPASVQNRGCSSPDFDPASCVYRTDLGEAQVRATKQGDGWIIDQVKVSPA
jgi:hypothetical protein